MRFFFHRPACFLSPGAVATRIKASMAAFGTFVQHQALLHVTVVGIPDGCESLCGKIYVYIYVYIYMQNSNYKCCMFFCMYNVVEHEECCCNILLKYLG